MSFATDLRTMTPYRAIALQTLHEVLEVNGGLLHSLIKLGEVASIFGEFVPNGVVDQFGNGP